MKLKGLRHHKGDAVLALALKIIFNSSASSMADNQRGLRKVGRSLYVCIAAQIGEWPESTRGTNPILKSQGIKVLDSKIRSMQDILE